MAELIPAVVERIYRDLATPRPPQPKPAPPIAPLKKPITRVEVDDILQRKHSASPEELQEILNTKNLALSESERNQISVDLTVAVAHRSRQCGRRDDPSAEFVAKVLGYAETPHGLIEREWVNAQLRAGSQAIARCRNHRPPQCECWSAMRATLWQARANGEKTPEAWAASRIYSFLEELELSSRPERGPGVA